MFGYNSDDDGLFDAVLNAAEGKKFKPTSQIRRPTSSDGRAMYKELVGYEKEAKAKQSLIFHAEYEQKRQKKRQKLEQQNEQGARLLKSSSLKKK
jgi:hypothetical protein